MKVAKWGNSLAVRIPADVAHVLDLHEGDEVNVSAAGSDQLQVEKKETREQILARIRAMRRPLPKDWKFDREEANRRR
jgi:antitoxin MazE